MSHWDNDPADDIAIGKMEKRKPGRPATGQNTKVIRVPLDFDRALAIKMHYDWLPIIEEYRSIARDNPLAVRNEKLIKLMQELGLG
jgi:hypothetical protein